jgi:hypothetical protein
MSVQALNIVVEEFADGRKVVDGPDSEVISVGTVKKLLAAIERHTIYRIEKECIEQDVPFGECSDCGVRHDDVLCCSEVAAADHPAKNPFACRFCGKYQEECTGSGFDDGIQAHDFTENGPTLPDATYFGIAIDRAHMEDREDADGHFDDEVDGRTLKEIPQCNRCPGPAQSGSCFWVKFPGASCARAMHLCHTCAIAAIVQGGTVKTYSGKPYLPF